MLNATGAEETTFKKAAGSYKRSRRLVWRPAGEQVSMAFNRLLNRAKS
jgi:hypothetical protein